MNQGQLSSQTPAFVEVIQAGSTFYIETGKMPFEVFNSALEFIMDSDSYADVTGQAVSITLGSRKVNGVIKILRLNKPASITFSSDFEADPSSSVVDPTKLNLITLIYFENWGGPGIGKVVYTNKLFTAI